MKEQLLRELCDDLDIEVVSRSFDGWLVCRCPFSEFKHSTGQDKDPSFFIKIEPSKLSGFHCFSCKSHGPMMSLVRQLEHWRKESYGNLSTKTLLNETPDSFDDYNTPTELDYDPEPLNKAAYLSMYPSAWSVDRAREYLIGRGISEGTAELLQLQYDEDELRILFPVFDFNAELYGFSGRSVLTKPEMAKVNEWRERRGRTLQYRHVKDYYGLPKEKLLLGEQLIDRDKPLWLLEGLFAFAHFIEIGAQQYVNPIASLGSRLSRYQADLILGYNRPVYLGYDMDAAGDIGIYGNVDASGKHEGGGAYDLLRHDLPVLIPLYPEGKPDPDLLSLEDVIEAMNDPLDN